MYSYIVVYPSFPPISTGGACISGDPFLQSLQLGAVALLITPRGAGREEAPVIASPGVSPRLRWWLLQVQTRPLAPVIAPLGVGRSKAPVVTDAEGYLVQRMALDAGWDTGALSQRNFLR